MNILTVDNHSFREDLLTKGPVLDVGCRGFRFAKFFADRGHSVTAMDPGEENIGHPRIAFLPLALVADMHDGRDQGKLVLTSDPEARYVVPAWRDVDCASKSVGCVDVNFLMNSLCHVDKFDLVKLNCEGAEFDILNRLERPIARQIVVSFHEHVGTARRGEEAVNELVQKLGKWYDVVRHEWDERYCAGRNAWDTVLVERGI